LKDYPNVDAYLADSNQWPNEIKAIRPILLSCQLDETIKWESLLPHDRLDTERFSHLPLRSTLTAYHHQGSDVPACRNRRE
jgi:hypothetical protein